MKTKKMWLLFLILFFFENTSIKAQDALPPPPPFLVGAFIQSMHPPYMYETQRYHYHRVLETGFNSVFQIAARQVDTVSSNLDSLALFTYVYTANDSGAEGSIKAKHPEFIDWISYFTHAKYMKWEAEGDPNLFPYNVRIRQDSLGVFYQEGETSGWRTTQNNQPGDMLISGPNYWQYPRYTHTNPGWNPDTIHYKAAFRMRIDSLSAVVLPVCSLFVTTTYFDTNDKKWKEEILKDSLITTEDFSNTSYKDIILRYNYAEYIYPTESNQNYPSPPVLISNPFGEPESAPGMNVGSQVQFKVKWLGNRHLFVDYIEVYDEQIWEKYFINDPVGLVSNIVTYDQKFKTANSNFYDKLHYYGTIDEPHVIDCYIPLRKVQEILDSVGINKKLLTHWYPGWDHNRDGDNTWPVYKKLAQPKKIMFWYSPYVNDEEGDEVPTDFTHYWFHRNLQHAHIQQPDFYVTLQSWGTKNLNTYEYDGYRYPTQEEISAGTMLSLAHGIKGIYYELFYSFYGSGDRLTLYEGIVDIPENNFEKMPIWNKINQLANRLNGTLGNTLMRLEYKANSENTGYLRLCRNASNPHIETPEVVSGNYLTLSSIPQNPSPGLVHFFAGFLEPSYQSENHYFLLTNLNTTSATQVTLSLTDNNHGYPNMRFRNVEPEFNFDTTFTNNYSEQITISAGEGYLYQVAPVIKYGGKIIYNETVSSNTILYDDLIIAEGATLTIQPGVTLQFKNNSKLIVKGTLNAVGNSSNKITFNFSEPDDNGIVVSDSGILILNYTNIHNASSGITSLGDIKRLNVTNTNFSNCTDYGINILGTCYYIPQIKHNTFNGSEYGLYAIGLRSIVAQYNTFTNTDLAIGLVQVPEAHIVGNYIESNKNSLPGIFINSGNGYVRGNYVSGHTIGLSMANSLPVVGTNIFQLNSINGIYVGPNSFPDLRARLIEDTCYNPPLYYPFSGFNHIINNGGYNSTELFNDDGSEIYIYNSSLQMGEGCNEVIDNRIPSGSLITTIYLMNGNNNWEEIDATYNVWGEHPQYNLEERFGELSIMYEPFLSESCPLPDVPIGCPLIVYDGDGNIIDTIYARAVPLNEKSEEEEMYAAAEGYFTSGDYEQAAQIYNSIITGNPDSYTSSEAYSRLFRIERLKQSPASVFEQLKAFYVSSLSLLSDTTLIKVLDHLTTLCYIDEELYISAIDRFVQIITSAPESEEAVYAEIDALTTSLLAGGNGQTLGKHSSSDYVANDGNSYKSKISNLLKNKFGGKKIASQKPFIPVVYSLFQNYPNPFNPTTTIRYDLPQQSIVELTIFDILGRKVKTLVNNEMKQAGRYEVMFNASRLPSGVYFYRIAAGDYISTKKMLLIK